MRSAQWTICTMFPKVGMLTFGHGCSPQSEATGNSQAEVRHDLGLLGLFGQENHVAWFYQQTFLLTPVNRVVIF